MLRRVRTAAPRWLALAIVAALAALVGPGRAVAAALPSTSFARAGAPSALLAVQQAELTASHATFGADFGWSVALWGDTALVAADGMTSAIPNVTGAAYVYTRSGTSWTLQQRLSDPDANSADTFGSSVALFGDTALVGADGATVDGWDAAGAAYVYTRSGKSWSLQEKLSDPDANSADTFGSSVALLGDTALVGADGATVGGESSVGAAYVYTRSGTSWSLQTELTDPAPALGSDFGWAVALATDTALVGAPFNTVGGNCGAGAAYLFTRSGMSWSPPTELTDPDGRLGFGCAVALSGDTALVCADGRTATPVGPGLGGAAYVFTRLGTSWPQQAELTGSDEMTDDDFGWSAALSGDTALIGAYGRDFSVYRRAGAAYVFTRSGTSWSQQLELDDPSVAADRPFDHDNFASSVALSGTTALVGADGQAVGRQRYAGAAYVEELAPVPLLSLKASTRSLKVCKRVTLSGAVQNFLAADKTVVIARKVGSRVMPPKNVSISRSGAFTWTTKATRTGRWIVTASYAVGATTYTSNVVKVIVRK